MLSSLTLQSREPCEGIFEDDIRSSHVGKLKRRLICILWSHSIAYHLLHGPALRALAGHE